VALKEPRYARRRLAIGVLVALVIAHLLAVGAYYTQARQQALLVKTLEAREQWKAGQLETAATLYRSILRERPSVAWPLILIRQFPQNADLWYLLGRVESDRANVDAALTAYAASIAAGGRGARETRELLLSHGRLTALLTFANERLAVEPLSPQPLKDRAAAKLEMGQARDAMDDYRTALDRLPAWRRQIDPAAPSGLSGEEADLLNLYAAAALAAHERTEADRACATITTRQGKRAQLDRLCRALIARADGRDADARHELAGYLPPASEHEWLTRGLLSEP
jgi:tetratricopeptide (TPR) repeat protein